ncbi:MAG TPA: glycosyltransferase family 4 protein [Armatimonadetes bacterium]|jgi:glycosyltransferase involved in cell wall biosynthesis|nr:glycosyltransferase family 4 protein [Armatimonadota bacterium]
MRVTFACPLHGYLYYGGAQVQADKTAEELANLGVEVEFLTPRTSTLGDLVHCFGPYAQFEPLTEVCESRGIPIVCSTIFYSEPKIRRLLSYWLRAHAPAGAHNTIRRLWQRSSALLPNSEVEAEQVCTLFGIPRQRMHVVPNGVEGRFTKGDPNLFREKFGIREPFVLNIGRVEDRKNQHRLIQALKGTGLKLVLIGKEWHQEYSALCRREADGNVLFLPPLAHDDPLLASAYAACRVFALPSLVETPGIVALEAGIAGARVITTPIGGGREYFGDHALYVNPYSVSDIRAKVLQAWNSAGDGEALQQHILRHFTWRRVAEKTLEVYERVLQRK